MNKEIIDIKVNDLFFNKFGLDMNSNKELKDDKLFGIKINMEVRDLLILLFDIESIFNIKIQDKDLFKGNFSTYNQIVATVYNTCCNNTL